MTNAIKVLLQMTSVSLQPVPTLSISVISPLNICVLLLKSYSNRSETATRGTWIANEWRL
jgi:hypothetical protein